MDKVFLILSDKRLMIPDLAIPISENDKILKVIVGKENNIAQNERYEQSKHIAVEKDALGIIRERYKAGRFQLAEHAEQFKGIKDEVLLYDGVVYSGYLCLRGATLLKLFPNASLKAIIDALQSQGALKRGSDKTSIQISATGGNRFFFIPLYKLY